MNILLLNCDLGPLPDHTVKRVSVKNGGVLSLRRYLAKANRDKESFQPDLIVQREALGNRIFFADLTSFPCPKVFWAIDSHLNLNWQRWYARLFDLVLTPHPHLFTELPVPFRPQKVLSFAVPGYERPFIPHANRKNFAAFVGVITEHREQRARFAAFLQKFHGISAQQLPFARMLELYDQSRVLPNESIAREFNFRIMEGASCGCCVLTEDIGEDLAINFTPSREVLLYRHAAELNDLLSFLKKRPSFTERIGEAARKRVLAEHLPQHRWRRLLNAAQSLSAKTLPADMARRFWLFAAIETATITGSQEELLRELFPLLQTLPEDDEVLAMRITCALKMGQREIAEQCMQKVLSSPPTKTTDLISASLFFALHSSDTTLFAHVLEHVKAVFSPPSPHPFDTFFALAKRYKDEGNRCWTGASFNAETIVPTTEFACLLLAERLADTEERKIMLHSALASLADALPFLNVNIMSRAFYSLDHQDDWRASFAYTLCALREFRLDEAEAECKATVILAEQAHETSALHELVQQNGLSSFLGRYR